MTRRLVGLGSMGAVVLAVTGTASLYGFVRLSEIIRDVEADVRGCLAVFFPGTKDQTEDDEVQGTENEEQGAESKTCCLQG